MTHPNVPCVSLIHPQTGVLQSDIGSSLREKKLFQTGPTRHHCATQTARIPEMFK